MCQTVSKVLYQYNSSLKQMNILMQIIARIDYHKCETFSLNLFQTLLIPDTFIFDSGG